MSEKTELRFRVAARSSVGRVRSGNEDALGHSDEAGVFVVCDGMGGAAGGEVASRTSVDAILKALGTAGPVSSLRARVGEAIAEANRLVFHRASRSPGLAGMGTTLVLLQLIPEGPAAEEIPAKPFGHALIAHVGDSRCYLFRNGHLIRQTADHSLVDEQVRLGQLTPRQAEQSPFRNIITRAIGTQAAVAPEITEIPLEAGDLFLLCSDGLTRELSDARIESILTESILTKASNVEATCRNLIDRANEAGGHDNITCLLVQIP
jgi:protein phosphatase